jgi:hypothetical protein
MGLTESFKSWSKMTGKPTPEWLTCQQPGGGGCEYDSYDQVC